MMRFVNRHLGTPVSIAQRKPSEVAGQNSRAALSARSLASAMVLITLAGSSGASAQSNPQPTKEQIAAYQAQVQAQLKVISDNPEADPNFPVTGAGFSDPKITWSFRGTGTVPVIQINTGYNGMAQYLGWNDEGSWFKGDRNVFVWNLKKNNLTQKSYRNVGEIPVAIIDNLKNNPYKRDNVVVAKADKPAPKPQPPPDTLGLGGAARTVTGLAGQGQAGAHVAPGGYNALSTSLKGNLLTLTLANGETRVLKVERAAVPGVPAQPMSKTNITGTWLAFDDNKVINVQGDGSAGVVDMDPRLRATFEMMKQQTGGAH